MLSSVKKQLLEIKSLIVEKDSKKSGKYWIWLNIHSGVRTVVRINARTIDDDDSDIFAEFDKIKERSMFMGHHFLIVGENKLPPLPVFLDEKTAGEATLVHFDVKSRSHPAAFNTCCEAIGPRCC